MLRNSVCRILGVSSRRGLKTSSRLNGGHGPAKTEETSKLKAWLWSKEHPKLHQGYLYREQGNLQGADNHTIGRFAITMAWFYVFYNLWNSPDNFLGHAPFPDTSKWTDKELGIPADDEE